jgi:hypothetical protein
MKPLSSIHNQLNAEEEEEEEEEEEVRNGWLIFGLFIAQDLNFIMILTRFLLRIYLFLTKIS